jgi:glyoxylase-like metal-dependent hydrolase (beta-lactamase superfamily II)
MNTRAANEVSRRQFLISSGVAVAAACLAPSSLFAQEGLVGIALKESATAKITVQALRRNISVLLGPGGNIAVLTGPDGKLLVDAEIGTARSNVTAALASINADPIKQLINTHWHFDHTGGNEWLHQAGASILAHENTRKRLSVDTRVEGWVYTFPAAPAGAIPTTVFQDEHTVHVNGSTLALKYYGPAHTDSDISVHFAEADVLHTGDTFWNRNYPFIDYSTGGSIDGQIRAAEANLAKVSATTIVIPGHGAVAGKADLTLFRDVLAEAREKVAKLKNNACQSFVDVILLCVIPATKWFVAVLSWSNKMRHVEGRESLSQRGIIPSGYEVVPPSLGRDVAGSDSNVRLGIGTTVVKVDFKHSDKPVSCRSLKHRREVLVRAILIFAHHAVPSFPEGQLVSVESPQIVRQD